MRDRGRESTLCAYAGLEILRKYGGQAAKGEDKQAPLASRLL